MYLPQLDTIPRLDLLGAPTPLTYLPRLSDYLGRVIMIKRDDLTPLGLGGNKLRKLEYLAADAISQGADVLLTAGAIQSNHVRQTASVAAKLGVHCVALLETPPGTDSQLYRKNGNRLLLGLSGVEVIPVANLNHPDQQLQEQAIRLEAQGFRPYIIPVGGSNVLGAMGYVACAREIAQQCEDLPPAAVVVASGSAGTHAGLAVGLQQWMPGTTLIGVTVSRKVEEQHPKVAQLTADTVARLGVKSALPITLWDDYFAPSYGVPNEAGNDAIRLLAQLEGLYLDPVYTAKAMAGLIDGVAQQRFPEEGPVLFIHTGGVPALFAYQDFF